MWAEMAETNERIQTARKNGPWAVVRKGWERKLMLNDSPGIRLTKSSRGIRGVEDWDCGPDKEKIVMCRDESERCERCEGIANNERYGLRKISCQVNNKNVRLGRNGVRGIWGNKQRRIYSSESPRCLPQPQMI